MRRSIVIEMGEGLGPVARITPDGRIEGLGIFRCQPTEAVLTQITGRNHAWDIGHLMRTGEKRRMYEREEV